MNLITKAYNRLRNSNVVKAGASLVVATALALTLAGCDETTNTQNNNPNQPSQTVQYHNVDYSNHSELLNYVLENDAYNKALSSQDFDTKLYSHPFAFLESQGFSTESIVNGERTCKSFCFILDDEPTNLYIATCVSDTANTYYTEYMLRYHLSQQEVKDFKSLFFVIREGFYDNAVFLADAVSKLHLGEEEILSCANIGIKGNENLSKALSDKPKFKQYTGTENNVTMISDFNNNDLTFSCYLFPQMFKCSSATKYRAEVHGKISLLPCQYVDVTDIYSTDDVFAIGDSNNKKLYFSYGGSFAIIPDSQVTTKNATFYSTYDNELTRTSYNENELH